MELRQLKYFEKIAELKSFTEASRELNITQSTLSQQLRKLEEELGVMLLLRDSHSVQLTDIGEAVLPAVSRTIKDANVCVNLINDVQELNTGVLNIGATVTFSPILAYAVSDFLRQHPGIKLNIFSRPMEELMLMLDREEIDVALSYRPLTPMYDNIESHILFNSRLCVVVSKHHPLAEKESIRLPELEQYRIVLPVSGMQARRTFDNVTKHADLKLDIAAEVNDIKILLDIVGNSNYLTMLSQATIPDNIGLKTIPLDQNEADMQGCFHFKKGTYRKKATKQFLKTLCEKNRFGINL